MGDEGGGCVPWNRCLEEGLGAVWGFWERSARGLGEICEESRKESGRGLGESGRGSGKGSGRSPEGLLKDSGIVTLAGTL